MDGGMDGFRIRFLEPGDSMEALTAMLHRAYAALAEMGMNFTATDQTAQTTRYRCGRGYCFVAVADDGALVGTIAVHGLEAGAKPHPYLKTGMMMMEQLGFEPAWQGRGVGSALMDAAEAKAVEMGFGELFLDTAEGAVHLIERYSRRGYAVRQTVQWPGKTYRSVVMSRRLGG
jgi:GNAT superfamily N-acetyltransferase